MPKDSKGIITRINGPVVDIMFPDLALPDIFHAVVIPTANATFTLEVLQHLSHNEVRCIAMQPTDGLSRGMTAIDTGAPISVPVGSGTLGRMTNVTGDPIDRAGEIVTEERWPIHHSAPHFTEIVTAGEILETGIKVIDLMTPYAKGARSVCSAVPGWEKPSSSWS